MSANASWLLTHLNSIRVGDLSAIKSKLLEAREGCVAMEQDGLAELLGEAISALDQADMKTYRKRVETVIARLGHIR